MTVEIKLRPKYARKGAAKNTGKGKGGGNAGARLAHDKTLPVGIRRRPRRRYGN